MLNFLKDCQHFFAGTQLGLILSAEHSEGLLGHAPLVFLSLLSISWWNSYTKTRSFRGTRICQRCYARVLLRSIQNLTHHESSIKQPCKGFTVGQPRLIDIIQWALWNLCLARSALWLPTLVL